MAKKAKSVDPARIGLTSYDVSAQVQKNSDAGLSWKPLGAASAAVRVGPHTPVMVFNTSGSTGFVAFGAAGMSAPSAATNGMPVLNNSIAIFNSGESEYVRASAANIFVYTADPEINQ